MFVSGFKIISNGWVRVCLFEIWLRAYRESKIIYLVRTLLSCKYPLFFLNLYI